MIMVDTGAWYAVCDASDANHQQAKAFYEKAAGAIPLITTAAIMTETWTLLSARLGRSAALTFWETLRTAGIPIVPLEERDIEAAWQTINAFPDQTFSFTDATTFAVMEKLGVKQVFTFDYHFFVYRYGAGRRKAFVCKP